MAVHRGLNPTEVPVTTLLSYIQTLPTLQQFAEDAQDADSGEAWWEQG